MTLQTQIPTPATEEVVDPPGDAPRAVRRKLDLSRLEPPAQLDESSIEEMTIDGICGVY